MVSIALVDARKTSLTGVQNSQKKSARRFAARKIAKKKSARRFAARKIAKKAASRFAARKIGKKNWLAASRLVKKKKKRKSARRYAARGRWVKPPLGKKLDPPLLLKYKLVTFNYLLTKFEDTLSLYVKFLGIIKGRNGGKALIILYICDRAHKGNGEWMVSTYFPSPKKIKDKKGE